MRRAVALGFLFAVFLAAGPDEFVPFSEAIYRQVLDESRGEVVLFNFWAAWCAPCRAEMPALARLENQLGMDGFRMVTVTADEPAERRAALRFLRESRVSGTAYARGPDGFVDVIEPRWSGALPAMFLYDRSGKLAARFVGDTPIEVIESAVRRLLSYPSR